MNLIEHHYFKNLFVIEFLFHLIYFFFKNTIKGNQICKMEIPLKNQHQIKYPNKIFHFFKNFINSFKFDLSEIPFYNQINNFKEK